MGCWRRRRCAARNTRGWFLASAGADAADLLGGMSVHREMKRSQQLIGMGGAVVGDRRRALGRGACGRTARSGSSAVNTRGCHGLSCDRETAMGASVRIGVLTFVTDEGIGPVELGEALEQRGF